MDMYHAYQSHLESVGVEEPKDGRQTGSFWTPLVDLRLQPLVTKPWMGWEREALFPARWISQIAAGPEVTALARGTILRFETLEINPWLYGYDSRVWSIADPAIDVAFLWSADDLRGGSDGMLASDLIVPIGHPRVGDDAFADQLVRDLQAIHLERRGPWRLDTGPAEPQIAHDLISPTTLEEGRPLSGNS